MSIILPIHTSDRILFKRCRRKWNWQSLIREGRQPKQSPGPLWYGSGFHYAMEDFHGLNKHGDPVTAFDAYVMAYRKASSSRLPDDWEDLVQLGHGMLGYYKQWLSNRNHLKTFVLNGIPQLEVNFEIDLEVDEEYLKYVNARLAEEKQISKVVYRGTIDRVVIDEDGLLWLLDYKTAKIMAIGHFETDPQISAYCWAAQTLYPNHNIAGFIYQQHKKTLPDYPRILAGGKISIAKNQSTTRPLYRESLINLYGHIDKVPADNMKYLNYLATQESEDADDFIRRDKCSRNQHQIETEGNKIYFEALDMINPELSLYPNPNRDCSWECQLNTACVALDAGYDWEEELENETVIMQERDESWRKFI